MNSREIYQPTIDVVFGEKTDWFNKAQDFTGDPDFFAWIDEPNVGESYTLNDQMISGLVIEDSLGVESDHSVLVTSEGNLYIVQEDVSNGQSWLKASWSSELANNRTLNPRKQFIETLTQLTNKTSEQFFTEAKESLNKQFSQTFDLDLVS